VSLTRRQIETGLREIGKRAREAGEVIEIALYGGSAIVLVFNFRKATRDVDVVVSGNTSSFRRYAREVALAAPTPASFSRSSNASILQA